MDVQANQEIDIVESSLNKELDEFQSEIDENFDILQQSVSKLTNSLFIKRRRIWRKSVFWVNRLKCNLRGN